jgi:phosphate transport system permease protein
LADGHRARRRQEAFAFGVIRALSGLTVAVLALIIGFIVVKGLRYSNEVRGAYLPVEEAAPDGLAVAVNEGTDLARIDFQVLLGMYTDEYINWSKIDSADLDLAPIAVDPATPEGKAAAALLFGPGADAANAAWGGLVAFVPSAGEALAKVAATPGAVAIVPANAPMPAGAKALPLRRTVLAVHPGVLELVGNRSVRDIEAGEAEKLLGGRVVNWKDLGGPDLPLVPTASGGAGVAAAIASTPGAVGRVTAAEAAEAELPSLTVKGRESGWNLDWRFLSEAPRLSGRVGGISTIIANTLFMLLLTVLFAAPIGVAAAVYLVEYARQGPLVRVLRLGTETLAGIPSIIFGLFGMLFFVDILGFGFGLLSGSLTLTLMILPTIVRTSEEALKAVPGSLREGSLALGATKLQTIFRVAVPAAAPGILTGVVLAIGRAVGETAALLFTMGSDYKLAKGLFSSARSLSAHVYLLFAEGISFDRAFATAAVLVLVVLAFNLAAKRLVKRTGRFAEQP